MAEPTPAPKKRVPRKKAAPAVEPEVVETPGPDAVLKADADNLVDPDRALTEPPRTAEQRVTYAPDPATVPEVPGHVVTGWGCSCGWQPNFGHALGLGLQQLRHIEREHGTK
ncbi:hypothetical protein SEA_DELYLAH_144 [Mycobacterium phage Delylah]|uniref:Uncharacterized protein n=1 Tax=Mycobacterium phage Nappy TaxID=1088866 RepID=G8IDY1_9CAUD|nr:hypothetical protein NAPPY_143 [Mycobacterium phage Nappy]AER25968.1 hypothetical protein NAPPY_143 [Mycobacterium phage Nappy]QYC53394.1 hypothetical protein SEA_DELYLAH_144 [Mycobacterium phage Delylah]